MVQKKITSFPLKNYAMFNGKDTDDSSLQGAPSNNNAIIGFAVIVGGGAIVRRRHQHHNY